MITKSNSFTTSDGQLFGELEKAQDHEISVLINDNFSEDNHPGKAAFVATLREHRDKIIDILTTGPKSRPRARRANKVKVIPTTEAPKR